MSTLQFYSKKLWSRVCWKDLSWAVSPFSLLLTIIFSLWEYSVYKCQSCQIIFIFFFVFISISKIIYFTLRATINNLVDNLWHIFFNIWILSCKGFYYTKINFNVIIGTNPSPSFNSTFIQGQFISSLFLQNEMSFWLLLLQKG